MTLLLFVVLAALAFDFINGFHDAANAIATSVATGVMSIRTAVIVSAVFNLIGAMVAIGVAQFITGGLITDPASCTPTVVMAALLGASAWNLITWWYGLPSSSSHALIGGLAGAVVVHAGLDSFRWGALTTKVLLPLVISPLAGFLIAFILMVGCLWVVRHFRPATVNGGARLMQLVSACTLSFAHGSNDAQKAMGIITLALVAWLGSVKVEPPAVSPIAATVNVTPAMAEERQRAIVAENARFKADLERVHAPAFVCEHPESIFPSATANPKTKRTDYSIPFWVILACALSMAGGTLAGGKRIIKTMGGKMIKLSPLQGFAGQTSGTAVILAFTWLKMPISTTHAITSSIMGAGATRGFAAVRWTTVINIVIAWVLTLPASALLAAGFYLLLMLCGVG